MRNSIQSSQRNSITARTVLSELSNNNMSDKNDIASTCINAEEYRGELQIQKVDPVLKLKRNT